MESKRVKTYQGKKFAVRGSNKLYTQLNDLDFIFNELKSKCPADLAKELDVPYNSLRYIIVTYFTEEEQEQIAWKRRRHTNVKRQ